MRNYNSNLAFVDLLFNLLIGFTSLFVISFLMINPVSKDGEVTPPVKAFVEVEWNPESFQDIDIFIKGPDGNILFFRNKDVAYATLERDDVGTSNDTYVINGETVVIKRNYEIVNFTQLPPGEYVINIFYFSSSGSAEDVKVNVRTISPHSVVYETVVKGLTPRKEHTVVTFMVDGNGNIYDINTNVKVPLAVGGQ